MQTLTLKNHFRTPVLLFTTISRVVYLSILLMVSVPLNAQEDSLAAGLRNIVVAVNPTVKSFVTSVADTVCQDQPFKVVYTLTASSWKGGDKPMSGKGFQLRDVAYEHLKVYPLSQLQVTATYTTSLSGWQELPGLGVQVGDKKVWAEKKRVYVKPHPDYGDEMLMAHQWLLKQGQHPDSLCLSMKVSDHGFFLFVDRRNHCFCMIAKKEAWPLVGQPVLAYSTEHAITISDDSKNYNSIVNPYRLQIEALRQTPDVQRSKSWLPPYQLQRDSIHPMLAQLQWGQSEPYNCASPVQEGKKAMVGCVPLSLGMVLSYYQWPSYQRSFEVNDTSQTIMELSAMLTSLGVAVGAEFGSEATSANFSVLKSHLCHDLGYSGRATYYEGDLAESEIAGLVYRDLAHHRPCIVSYDGHVFVCDGYKDDFLHFNFGWYGNFNGYYRLKLGNYELPEGYKSLLLINSLMAHIEPLREELRREVTLQQPGTLAQQLSADDVEHVTSLVVSGPLNSSDLLLLRKMAGAVDGDPLDSWQGGALTQLDLKNATIVDDQQPYLTIPATGSWNKTIKTGNVSRNMTYDFETMTEQSWNQFKTDIGLVHEGFFYTRSDDNRYWVNYHCQKNHIGLKMFSNCTSLQSIVLPDATRKICDYAFEECSSLRAIRIPAATEQLGRTPFFYCPSLEKIEIPVTLNPAGTVFEGCSPALKACESY